MKRWHEEKAVMERQRKVRIRVLGTSHMKTGAGRFRKLHALDCGKSRCAGCHSDKFYGPRTRTRQEKLAARSHREQLADCD